MSGEKNFSMESIGNFDQFSEKGRIMLGQQLGLTGCEISINSLRPGTFTPFVHSHQLNEESYIILSGKGEFKVDDSEFEIKEGDVIRVAPKGERAIKAGDEELVFVCIQSQVNSLTQATESDGVINETKASWM